MQSGPQQPAASWIVGQVRGGDRQTCEYAKQESRPAFTQPLENAKKQSTKAHRRENVVVQSVKNVLRNKREQQWHADAQFQAFRLNCACDQITEREMTMRILRGEVKKQVLIDTAKERERGGENKDASSATTQRSRITTLSLPFAKVFDPPETFIKTSPAAEPQQLV